MAVYNSAAYVGEALRSVVNQRGVEWECIVVDDGSTDGTSEILTQFARGDGRIQVVRQENAGQSAALNRAIEMSTAPWLARLDGDDLFVSDKLKTQYEYLQSRANIDICGTWCESFGAAKKACLVKFPNDDMEIRGTMFFQCPLMHPSTMIRKSVLTENGLRYRGDACNDYDLWIRALPVATFANMPRALTRYRVHPQQMTAKFSTKKYYGCLREIMSPLFQSIEIDPTIEEFRTHVDVGHYQCKSSKQFLKCVTLWFDRLLKANFEAHAIPVDCFNMEVEKRFWYACNVAAPLGFYAWNTYWQSHFRSRFKPSAIQVAKFALKCGIGGDKGRESE